MEPSLRTVRTTTLLAATLLLAGIASPARAQHESPPDPAAYALEGVTLVRPGGGAVSGVNLVIRGAVLEAVGPDVPVPEDAEVLEGDSLRVYPGLVDAEGGTELAWPGERSRGGGDGGGRGGGDEEVVPWNPGREAQGFTPARRAVDAVGVAGEDLASARKSGVVASALLPADGIAPGSGVLLLHRRDAGTPRGLVLRPELGPVLAFETADQAYPGTHFGVVAYLRQQFEDAGRLQAVQAAHRRSAAGMEAPAWDPALETLAAATDGSPPVFFRAHRAQDIRQALEMAEARGFRPAIVGGREAWRVADRLAAADVPVLVSLDFPKAQRWKPGEEEESPGRKPGPEPPEGEAPPDSAGGGEPGGAEAGAAADTSAAGGSGEQELEPEVLREKRRLEDAYANAGRLVEAGVRVALTSGGGEADLREGARTAVEHGLPREEALRALTTVPAGLLGAPWLTRAEAGYPANLVVTSAPLLEEGTEIRYTFVEGRLEVGVEPGAEPEEPPAVDVTGRWEMEMEGSMGSFDVTLSLEQQGARFEGTMNTQFGPGKVVNGVVSGSEVSFALVVDAGGDTVRLDLSGEASGDEMSGTGSGPPQMGSITWEATRAGPGGGEGR